MKEYDDETLHHVQCLELMILKDFIKVCTEHNLTYFAYAGTGLGALRHKGFIPWDDDIDVCLPAADHDKVLRIFEEQYSDKYEVINAQKNPQYPLPTSRIMIKGTQFCEEALRDLPLDLGIFLDVYSLDTVSEGEKAFRKQARRAWFWSHLRLLKLIPRPFIVFHGWKGRLIKAATYTVGTLVSLLPISLERCVAKEMQVRRMHADKPWKRVAYMCDTLPYDSSWTYDEVFPLQQLEFEGMKVNFPANLHEHLTKFYGDYMQLPPVEQRKNHYPARLDFGTW